MVEIRAKGKGFSRDEQDKALTEFGKNAFVNSVSVIQEHIKLMIPLTTGLITAYFALLEFLGIKTALDAKEFSASSIVDPAFLMLASLVCFVITSFPVLKQLNLNNFSSVSSYRNFMVAWRYAGAGIGMGLFLFGILAMIFVLRTVLEHS